MKPQPQPLNLPQPVNMVVAVHNFPPEHYRLVYLTDVEDMGGQVVRAGTDVPIYGWNRRTRRVYIPGPYRTDFRLTDQEQDYENEHWCGEIPERMAEVDLNQYPKNTFLIHTPDAKTESLPQFEKKKRGCKIIKHWATIDHELEQAQERARLTIQPEPEPVAINGQYRIGFTENDYQPLKTA